MNIYQYIIIIVLFALGMATPVFSIINAQEIQYCKTIKQVSTHMAIEIIHGSSRTELIRMINYDTRLERNLMQEIAIEIVDVGIELYTKDVLETIDDVHVFSQFIYIRCTNNNTFETGTLSSSVTNDKYY